MELFSYMLVAPSTLVNHCSKVSILRALGSNGY